MGSGLALVAHDPPVRVFAGVGARPAVHPVTDVRPAEQPIVAGLSEQPGRPRKTVGLILDLGGSVRLDHAR